MSLMMTGMVGGLGKSALDQSAHLKQQEDADAGSAPGICRISPYKSGKVFALRL